jgi:hypothetical protein
MPNESVGIQRNVGVWMMQEEGMMWLTIAKRKKGCVGMVCQHGAECIIATDDSNGGWYESSFGVGDDEINSPRMKLDMLDEQTRGCVLLNTENTIEGKDRSTPVASISEDSKIDLRMDGEQVIGSDGRSRLSKVSVAVPVREPGDDPAIDGTSRKGRVAHTHGEMDHCRNESWESGDAMVACI